MDEAHRLTNLPQARRAPEEARSRAFVRLAETELPSLYRLAALIVGSDALAEDLVGDALERAWRTWGDLRDADRFCPWLTRIVVNACRDELRRRARIRFVSLNEEGRQPEPGALVDDRDAIARAFASLDADERAVAVLRLDQDLPLEEIARRLGIPVGTAKSRLHRAIARMRAELSRTER